MVKKFQVVKKEDSLDSATIDFVLDHYFPSKDRNVVSKVIAKSARKILNQRFNWSDDILEGSRVVSITVN